MATARAAAATAAAGLAAMETAVKAREVAAMVLLALEAVARAAEAMEVAATGRRGDGQKPNTPRGVEPLRPRTLSEAGTPCLGSAIEVRTVRGSQPASQPASTSRQHRCDQHHCGRGFALRKCTVQAAVRKVCNKPVCSAECCSHTSRLRASMTRLLLHESSHHDGPVACERRGIRHAGELRALPSMHRTYTDHTPGDSARFGRFEAWRST